MNFRPAILLGLASVLALAQSSADKAVIEGKVVSRTGAALAKATVTLMPLNPVPRPNDGTAPVNVVATDAGGVFKFENIEPGRYTLNAERVTYVSQNYGARAPGKNGTPLEVPAGAHLTGLAIEMTPQGLISGKIMDEDGDPVANAIVAIYQTRYVNGSRQLRQVGGAVLNPDGTYMAGRLAPGRYYVGANVMRWGGPNVSQSTRLAQAPLTTYYPSATELASAVAIELTAGADVRGIDLRLVSGRVYQIRGKVTGLPDAASDHSAIPNSSVTLSLNRKNENSNNFAPVNQRDGTFVFHNVAPGDYTIQSARILSGGSDPSRLMAYAPVTVADQDLDGVTVEVGPGAALAGTVKMEGSNDAPAPVRIALAPSDGFGANGMQSDRNGAFQIQGLVPQTYRLNVAGLPQGAYVKSIRAGSQEIAPDKLDLSAGPFGPLEILLSPDAGEVTGIVRNEKGDAISNATVALWQPVNPTAFYNLPPRQASSDQNGNFTVSNLPPGEYLIAAWEDLETGVWQNPDFLARYESSAPHVKLTPSGRMAMEVKAADAESAASEVARLP